MKSKTRTHRKSWKYGCFGTNTTTTTTGNPSQIQSYRENSIRHIFAPNCSLASATLLRTLPRISSIRLNYFYLYTWIEVHTRRKACRQKTEKEGLFRVLCLIGLIFSSSLSTPHGSQQSANLREHARVSSSRVHLAWFLCCRSSVVLLAPHRALLHLNRKEYSHTVLKRLLLSCKATMRAYPPAEGKYVYIYVFSTLDGVVFFFRIHARPECAGATINRLARYILI